MNHLFYTPDFAKTGDVIPFFRKGSKTFEGYYLKNWNPDAPKDRVIHAWHHIVSENNRDYIETPTNIDGGNFYAAKIGYDGENHYVYGWNPSRGENNWGFDPSKDLGKDYQSYNWGGSLIVHKIIQHEDGTLGCAPVDAVEQAFKCWEKMEIQVLDGDWKLGEDELSIDSPDGYSCLLLNPEKPLAPICALSMKLKCSDHPTRFGLALQVDKSFAQGYYLMFEPKYHRIQYRSGLRMYEQGGQMFPYTVELERPIDLEEQQELEIQVFIQDSIGLLYVNHDLAFSFRMYNEKEKGVGLFVEDGTMVSSEIRYAE